uniref:Transmembrane protein 248 n=1 Tax=Vombatus ursinus TaxID=29139 RepID=A0A4X2KE47_VOMUR
MRIMFNINPLENLKAHISSRPPLVVFMVSVSAMAIAFLTLGYFFKIKEIKSPEMAEDWNTFLLRFNDLDLCVSENETLKHLLNDTATSETAVTSGQARSATQAPQALEDSGPTNVSVAITLTLDPLKPFGGYSRNVTHLYSTILGHQIGLSGREAHEEINITFTLPAAWNSDDCVLHGHCEQVVFTACMTVTAATNVFPVTVQPPHCIPETYSNATLWYKVFTTARDANTKYAQDYNPFWCYKGAIGKVYHTLNPKLTVIVPDDDRSLINLHLMHTSYFLFVMVITMFCYAVIKGRPSKLRQSNSEFCPEKVSRMTGGGRQPGQSRLPQAADRRMGISSQASSDCGRQAGGFHLSCLPESKGTDLRGRGSLFHEQNPSAPSPLHVFWPALFL